MIEALLPAPANESARTRALRSLVTVAGGMHALALTAGVGVKDKAPVEHRLDHIHERGMDDAIAQRRSGVGRASSSLLTKKSREAQR